MMQVQQHSTTQYSIPYTRVSSIRIEKRTKPLEYHPRQLYFYLQNLNIIHDTNNGLFPFPWFAYLERENDIRKKKVEKVTYLILLLALAKKNVSFISPGQVYNRKYVFIRNCMKFILYEFKHMFDRMNPNHNSIFECWSAKYESYQTDCLKFQTLHYMEAAYNSLLTFI